MAYFTDTPSGTPAADQRVSEEAGGEQRAEFTVGVEVLP